MGYQWAKRIWGDLKNEVRWIAESDLRIQKLPAEEIESIIRQELRVSKVIFCSFLALALADLINFTILTSQG